MSIWVSKEPYRSDKLICGIEQPQIRKKFGQKCEKLNYPIFPLYFEQTPLYLEIENRGNFPTSQEQMVFFFCLIRASGTFSDRPIKDWSTNHFFTPPYCTGCLRKNALFQISYIVHFIDFNHGNMILYNIKYIHLIVFPLIISSFVIILPLDISKK